jgi:lipooligosaccharide transport system permease protein
MFFSPGRVPTDDLPQNIRFVAEILPLTHAVRLSRAVCSSDYTPALLGSVAYIAVFTPVMGMLAIRRLRNRLVQ